MRRLTSRIAIASLSEGYLDRFHKCGLRTLRPQRRDRDNHGRLAGLRNVRQADLNRESPVLASSHTIAAGALSAATSWMAYLHSTWESADPARYPSR